MKPRYCLGVIALLLLAVLEGHAQDGPPPNDNFTNRIVLTGRDVVFDGTLAGATREWVWSGTYQSMVPEICGYPIFNGFPSQTVWWTWTAPESTTAIMQILSSSTNSFRTDGLVVYTVTNNDAGYAIAGINIDTEMPWPYFTFPAVAGTAYQIQLVGGDSASYTMRLVATNLPWIIEQPMSQAVSTDDSVLFTVAVAGLKPFTYQWQFSGTNLPGETAPMLALDHVTLDQAGAYQVLIPNPSGITTSSVATLLIATTDPAAELAALSPTSPGQFAFGLLGDVGRRYRIQSSTNLLDWSAEASFLPAIFYDGYLGGTVWQKVPKSVVVDSSGADAFSVGLTAPQKFLRATTFHAINEVCNNNIKRLRFAQLLFGCDGQYDRGMSVDYASILPYLKDGLSIHCPADPNCQYGCCYEIFTVLRDPQCPLGIHPFEEP